MLVRESERLAIRQMELADAEFIFRQLNEPSWFRFIGDRGVRNIEDARRYIKERVFEQYRTLGFGLNTVWLKASDEPVGICGLVKRENLPDPDLGFALLEAHWGKGYAAEATTAVLAHAQEVLRIPRLLAIAAPTNERSARLLMKLGFKLQEQVHITPEGQVLKLYAYTT